MLSRLHIAIPKCSSAVQSGPGGISDDAGAPASVKRRSRLMVHRVVVRLPQVGERASTVPIQHSDQVRLLDTQPSPEQQGGVSPIPLPYLTPSIALQRTPSAEDDAQARLQVRHSRRIRR